MFWHTRENVVDYAHCVLQQNVQGLLSRLWWQGLTRVRRKTGLETQAIKARWPVLWNSIFEHFLQRE